MTTTWTPHWDQSVTNAQGYCATGQHFVPPGTAVWNYWQTPLLSKAMCCDECAKKVTL